MEPRISKDIAVQDVIAWLDIKRVPERKREEHKDAIADLVGAIMDGTLTVDTTTGEFTHTLVFPLSNPKGEVTVTELKYKARVSVEQIKAKTGSVKASDVEGRILAYVAALTGQATGVLEKLDTVDNSIATAIVTFFF